MHILEILNNKTIDFHKEALKIFALLNENVDEYLSYNSEHTLLDLIDNNFRQLKLAGNMISVEEILTYEDFSLCYTIEQFSLLCEKVLTLLKQVFKYIKEASEYNIVVIEQKQSLIMKIINIDLDLCALSVDYINDKEKGILAFVYPKDVLIAKSIEAEPNLTESIIYYSRISNKGNLVEKEKYLHFIIKTVEPIIKNKDFKYKKVAEQASTIFNEFNIRHNNEEGAHKNDVLPKLSKTELETIYDMGYRLSLELLVLNEFEDIDTKVDALRLELKKARK